MRGRYLQGYGLPVDTVGEVGDTFWDLRTNYQFGPKTAAGWGRLVQAMDSADATKFTLSDDEYAQLKRRQVFTERAKDLVALFEDVDGTGISLRDLETVLQLAEDGLDARNDRSPPWREGLTGDAYVQQQERLKTHVDHEQLLKKLTYIIAYISQTHLSILAARKDTP